MYDISLYIYVIILFFIEQKLALIKHTLFSSKYFCCNYKLIRMT